MLNAGGVGVGPVSAGAIAGAHASAGAAAGVGVLSCRLVESDVP